MLIKSAKAVKEPYSVTEGDLELINQYTIQPLKGEDVFAFPVRLCDNALDRDHECFTVAALEKLAEMFTGKPGIFDHCWSAKGQTARIFRTEVVFAPGEGKAALPDEEYTYLKGYAYMVRTSETESAIAQISGGILKEVSVGFACDAPTCTVCGKPLGSAGCAHRKGQSYDGVLCAGVMDEPLDAYEWSFVAVPAQPKAGVTKAFEDAPVPPAEEASAEDMDDEDLLAVEKMRFGGI